MTSPETRFSLIARLHDARDVEAWTEFIELYQPLIFRIARQRGLQYADALEVTQEVLARVHANIGRWRPEREKGSFRGWLHCITRNLTIDFLRKRKLPQDDSNSRHGSFSIEELPDPSDDASREFNLEFERQLFTWAAQHSQSEFQPQTWRAFWLSAVDNIPIEEVARELEMSRGAVYVARSRVMHRLTKQIQARLEDSSF